MGFYPDKNIMELLCPSLMLISLNLQKVAVNNIAEEGTYFSLSSLD